MYNILALIGEAGSGKDTILRKLIDDTKHYYNGKLPLHEIISYTSRPPREKEVNGVNYHFISAEKFAEMILQNQMFEATVFNEWCYGTGVESVKENAINVGVFNPEGAETLLHDKRVNLVIVYIRADDKIRLIRQLNREASPDIDEIIRRYKADKLDFEDADNLCNRSYTNNTLSELEYIYKDLALFLSKWSGHLGTIY